jgi:stalled ribosome rescue protein Dom34
VIAAVEQNFSGENSNSYQKVTCVAIGSPGFVMENFHKYLKETVEKKSSEFLKDFCSKVITAHCSSGFKHSLGELLSS